MYVSIITNFRKLKSHQLVWEQKRGLKCQQHGHILEKIHSFWTQKHNINPALLINSESTPYTEAAELSPGCSSWVSMESEIEASSPTSPVSSNLGNRKIDEENLERSELKTQKDVHKAAKVLVKFMEKKFGLSVESSDSD